MWSQNSKVSKCKIIFWFTLFAFEILRISWLIFKMMAMSVKMLKARRRSQKRHTNRCESNKTQNFRGRSLIRTGGSKAKNRCPIDLKTLPLLRVVKAELVLWDGQLSFWHRLIHEEPSPFPDSTFYIMFTSPWQKRHEMASPRRSLSLETIDLPFYFVHFSSSISSASTVSCNCILRRLALISAFSLALWSRLSSSSNFSWL